MNLLCIPLVELEEFATDRPSLLSTLLRQVLLQFLSLLSEQPCGSQQRNYPQGIPGLYAASA